MSLCAAAALSIGLHLGSYHTDLNNNYNNLNPGVYVRFGDHQIGAYRNSIRNNTLYYAHSFNLDSACRFQLAAGIATGYKTTLMPLVAGVINFDTSSFVNRSKLRVLVGPTLSDSKPSGLVIHAAVEKSF
jgi:hypothetical protein